MYVLAIEEMYKPFSTMKKDFSEHVKYLALSHDEHNERKLDFQT